MAAIEARATVVPYSGHQPQFVAAAVDDVRQIEGAPPHPHACVSDLAGLGEPPLDPHPAVSARLARLVPDLLVEPARESTERHENVRGDDDGV